MIMKQDKTEIKKSDSIATSLDENNDILSTCSCTYTRTPKTIFSLSKLYHKYLSAVNMKIINSNITKTNDIKTFEEFYENANIIYENIKNDWFWISNGEKMNQFMLKSESIDDHKNNLYNNYEMLENIAKMYGYEAWSNKKKTNKKNMNQIVSIQEAT